MAKAESMVQMAPGVLGTVAPDPDGFIVAVVPVDTEIAFFIVLAQGQTREEAIKKAVASTRRLLEALEGEAAVIRAMASGEKHYC